jgi:hypothetical protein
METPSLLLNGDSLDATDTDKVPEFKPWEPKYAIRDPKPEDMTKGIHYDNLGSLLRKCSFPHAEKRNKIFWPYKLLRRIITRERVIEELQTYTQKYPGILNSKDIKPYADKILAPKSSGKQYIKIFAILVLIGKGVYIGELMDEVEGVCDNDLPLVAFEGFLAHRRSPDVDIKCLSKWEIQERDSFEAWQARVNVVFLSFNSDRSVKHEVFGPEVIFHGHTIKKTPAKVAMEPCFPLKHPKRLTILMEHSMR